MENVVIKGTILLSVSIKGKKTEIIKSLSFFLNAGWFKKKVWPSAPNWSVLNQTSLMENSAFVPRANSALREKNELRYFSIYSAIYKNWDKRYKWYTAPYVKNELHYTPNKTSYNIS